MKAAPLMLLVALPLVLNAGELKIGDSLQQVESTLGAPRGRAQMGPRELWSYERGEVELHSRLVTRISLRSEEAQTAYETKRAVAESRVREEQELLRRKLTAEGEALKASKLADSLFQRAPAKQQLEFWRNFASCYPNVSCAAQLHLARAEFYTQEQAERIEAESAQRLAELKARESHTPTFYPIPSDCAYRDNRSDRTRRILDRDNDERVRSSTRESNPASCQNDGEQRFQSYPSTNDSLLAAGQNVMAWDGTKIPGGEAAGLFR